MSSVSKTAGAAGSLALTIRNSAGQLVTPVSTPVVVWYTDAGRTLGATTLAVTGSGSSYTASWTGVQAPAAPASRYLKVTIEVSTGVFDTDVDDSISFVDAVSSLGPTALATLDELKAHLNNPTDATDPELQAFLDAATPAIEDITGPILPVTLTEDHYPAGASIVIDQPPLLSVTSLTEYRGNTAYPYTEVQNPSQASTYTFRVQPGNGGTITRIGNGGAVVPFAGPVQIVYTAGMTSVPADLHLAALEFARDLWQQTQQAPGGYGAEPADDLGGTHSTPRWRVLSQRWSRRHQAVY